jgi:hypothetical protein
MSHSSASFAACKAAVRLQTRRGLAGAERLSSPTTAGATKVAIASPRAHTRCGTTIVRAKSGPKPEPLSDISVYGDGSTQLVVPPPMLVVANRAVVYEEPQ